MTFDTTRNAISSPGSADGPMQLDWLDGLTTERSGPDHAPASHSASQGSDSPTVIRAISGPTSPGSSRTAALQPSLENRLQARLADYGSPEYALTWKHWDMASGPRICALRASPRRTPGNDCGGWPTCTGQDAIGSRRATARKNHWKSNTGTTLNDAAWFASGWPTPNAGPQNDTDTKWQERRARIKAEKKNGNGFGITLGMAAQLASNGSNAQTEEVVALNPELSRWLQGYPDTWSRFAPTETASSLKKRRKC